MPAQRQCSLTRGPARQVSWLPERFARSGATLRLKRADGTWEDGWVVEHVGQARDTNPPRTMWGDMERARGIFRSKG